MDELESRLAKLEARVDAGFEAIKGNFRITDSREHAIAEALNDLNARVAVLELNADGTIPQDD